MIGTNPSSNAATVSIYLLKSFIVSNVRDALVYIFGGLKTMLSYVEFSSFHPIIRPSVCQSVCTYVCMYVTVALHSVLSFLICFCFLESLTELVFFVLSTTTRIMLLI